MSPMRHVYLHGFASSPASTKARYFAERLRGHGIPLDIPDLAQGDFEHLTLSSQLAVVDRATAGEQSVLIGSSLGGYIAALYASRHAHVNRLLLLAPAFCFPSRYPAELGKETLENWRQTGLLPVFHYAHGEPRNLSYSIVEDGRRYEDFPDFTQPAILAHGLHDTVVPASLSREYSVSHPNVRLHLLDSGHQLTNVLDQIWQFSGPFLEGKVSQPA